MPKFRDMTGIPAQHQRCTHCGEVKPYHDFPPMKTTRNGRGSWCHDCINAHNKGRKR